ncbi:MAG: alpha/beta hydrolase [Gemmatimonadota bacterium]
MTPTLQYTAVREFRVHSLHVGSGPPVVLLHGLSGSFRWWRYVVPALAERFTVHVPELLGFGRSRPALASFTIAELAAVMAEWLETRSLGRCHVIGHSMGAQVALHLAAKYATCIDRLVLVSASGIPRPLSPQETLRFLTEVVPPRAWGAPLFLPRIALDALRAGPRTLLRATLGLLADDVSMLLPRIKMPTLLIWGEYDPLTPLTHGQRMADTIPDARLAILPRAAHNPMVDQPEAFNREVLDFLL